MIEMQATHLVQILKNTVERAPQKAGLLFKREGVWEKIPWSEVWERVLETAALLKRLGVKPGDRVALWSENRPEWLYVDMAALALGAVTVPI